MSLPAHFPYRSAAVRDTYLAHYDALAAKEWPVVSEERMVPTSYGQTFVRITGPADAAPRPVTRRVLHVADVGSQYQGAIRGLPDVCG
jgi:hypothetical protein